jgi:hypothetical protein
LDVSNRRCRCRIVASPSGHQINRSRRTTHYDFRPESGAGSSHSYCSSSTKASSFIMWSDVWPHFAANKQEPGFLPCICVSWLVQRRPGFQEMAEAKSQPTSLKGWKAIAQFLGQPSSTAQRWAKEGMPVERTGRMVQAFPDKLNLWLGRVTHEPVQIATETPDLSAELRRGLAYVRSTRKRKAAPKRRGK